MNITEISSGSGVESSEELRALAVSEFVTSCRLAPYAQFYSMTGNADTPNKSDGDITAGATRTISTNYTAKENTPAYAALSLVIMGDLVQTDIAHKRRNLNMGNQRTRDLVNFSRSLGRYFTDRSFNGTTAGSDISGLVEQTTALSRKVVFDTVNGGAVPTGNASTDRKQQEKFLESLDALIEDIIDGPSVICMNGALKSRFGTIARNFVTYSNVQDVYGANQVVTYYKEIPIVNVGFTANGTGQIIGSAETEGTSSDCTSLYAFRFGEEENVTYATNIGLDVRDLGQGGTKMQTLVEFDVALGILNAKAVKRMSGIRLSA